MNVPKVKIGSLAEQIRGVSYGKQDASDSPVTGYLPILRAGNITDEGLVYEDLIFVPRDRVSAKQRIRRHDVVIAASSGSLEVVGKAAPAAGDFEGGFGAFCKVLRPTNKVHPGYFAHFFKTGGYRRRISALAAGANINNLRNEHLDDLEIPLPSLSEQRRIAEILDRAEALRARRRKALAHLDSLTQAIFRDLFGDPVRNDRDLPTRRLIDLVDPDRGISYGIVQRGPDVDDGVAVLRISDVVNGEIDPSRVKRTAPDISKKYRRTVLRGGELVVSIRGTIGRCAVVPEELAGGNISRELALVPQAGIDTQFLLTLLRCESVQRRIGADVKGVAQRGINLADLRELPVICPPDVAVHEFRRRALAVRRLSQKHLESASGLTELMASLQRRAFSGGLT